MERDIFVSLIAFTLYWLNNVSWNVKVGVGNLVKMYPNVQMLLLLDNQLAE